MRRYLKPIKNSSKEELKRIYSERYKQTFSTSFAGIHSTIVHYIKDFLEEGGRTVLDIGCGAGRLALMCAQFAERVDAFDFEQRAIDTAWQIAEMSNTKNTQFYVGDIDELGQEDKYDLVTLSEVIEHIPNPVGVLRKIYKLLKDDGLLVISCPNFINFRGDLYMTMKLLFNLQMSLADLHQIAPHQMEHWVERANFKVLKVIGTLYDLGWLDRARQDLIKRMPLAWHSKGLDEIIEIDKLNEYLELRVFYNQFFLEKLADGNHLKRRNRVVVPLERGANMSDAEWDTISGYMDDGWETGENFYHSGTFPYNLMGAGTIYIVGKE